MEVTKDLESYYLSRRVERIKYKFKFTSSRIQEEKSIKMARSLFIAICFLYFRILHASKPDTLATDELIKANYGTHIDPSNERSKPSRNENMQNSESSLQISQIDSVKAIKDDGSKPEALSRIQRVWTASSSASLDELSPQVISRIHQDVPFLNAYAVRPRLVGGQSLVMIDDAKQLARRHHQSGKLQTGASSQRPITSRLGDIQELNIDVSSTSKSEHHHRRKTSLKRANGKPKLAKSIQTGVLPLKTRNKDEQRRSMRSGTKFGERRREKNHRAKGASKLEIVPKRFMTFGQQAASPSKTNDGGVKGNSNGNRTPFFSSLKPGRDQADDVGRGQEQPADAKGTESTSIGDGDIVEGEPEDEPKRVGDPDVEEDGDTVTVMPKFDGVDDNPDLALDEDIDSASEQTDDSVPSDGEMNTRDENGSGVAGGGGIGATVGSQGPKDGTKSSIDERPENENPTDKEDSKDSKVDERVKPGVEFSNDDESGEAEENDEMNGDSIGSSQPNSGSTVKMGDRDPVSDRTKPDINYDERPDISMNGLGSSIGVGNESSRGSGKEHQDSNKDNESGSENIDGLVDEKADGHKKKGTGKSREECEEVDGGHGDGEYHHHGHHNHHDTIKWLQDAIPGEPGRDYPILSRPDNSSNSFNCREQKWPGYYADVKSRCQVSWQAQDSSRIISNMTSQFLTFTTN